MLIIQLDRPGFKRRQQTSLAPKLSGNVPEGVVVPNSWTVFVRDLLAQLQRGARLDVSLCSWHYSNSLSDYCVAFGISSGA